MTPGQLLFWLVVLVGGTLGAVSSVMGVAWSVGLLARQDSPGPVGRRRRHVILCGDCGVSFAVDSACARCGGRAWRSLMLLGAAERAR